MQRRVCFILCIILILVNLAVLCAAAAPKPETAPMQVPELSAKTAALIDFRSGRVLYEKDGDEPMLIASTTKIMTALVVLENCGLDDMVRVSPEAVGIEGSSLYLKAGERISVRDLLYGLMLRSGNDAAVALAIHCAGSVEEFVRLMNGRAQELDLRNCRFANPNGLDDDNHYCSALDLARITAEAMKSEDFRTIVSTKNYRAGGRAFKNHNKLLWYYDGAVGVKTGYTKKSGRTLVGAADIDRGTIISVTLDASNDWSDQKKLFDYGYNNFTQKECVTKGEVIGRIPVFTGQADYVRVIADEDFYYPLAQDEELTKKILLPQYIFAPVTDGDVLGTVEYYLDKELVGCVDLIPENAVELCRCADKSLLDKIIGIFKKDTK